MATGGLLWSKKVCSVSTNTNSAYLTFDATEETLYFTSDVSNSFCFICKLEILDGTSSYCAKFDGDSSDYTYQLKAPGDYLLVRGYSSSTLFRGSNSWGNFVLWINKDLKSDACISLNTA